MFVNYNGLLNELGKELRQETKAIFFYIFTRHILLLVMNVI